MTPQMKWFLYELNELLKKHHVEMSPYHDDAANELIAYPTEQSVIGNLLTEVYFDPNEISKSIGEDYYPPVKLIDWRTDVEQPGYEPQPLCFANGKVADALSKKRVFASSIDTELSCGSVGNFFIHDGDLYGQLQMSVRPTAVTVTYEAMPGHEINSISDISEVFCNVPTDVETAAWLSEMDAADPNAAVPDEESPQPYKETK